MGELGSICCMGSGITHEIDELDRVTVWHITIASGVAEKARL